MGRARQFTTKISYEVQFGVNAVADAFSEDFGNGVREGIIGLTGGRTGSGFWEQVWDGYAQTSIVVGPLSSLDRRISTLGVVGAIGRQAGYPLSPARWALRGFPAMGPWPTRLTTASHVGAGVVVRGVLVGAAYETGNFIGSFGRTVINRTLIYFDP